MVNRPGAEARVGARIRYLRGRAMLSQVELASRAGLNRGTILNLESGRTAPLAATLRLLAASLDLDDEERDWLVTGAGAPGPSPEPPPGARRETPFVGRDAEIAAISAAFADPAIRLLTLTGPGGIGKTRLALEAAAVMAGNFAAVDIVPLANLADPGDVLPAIAAALHVPAAGASLHEKVAEALRGQRRLLVLDNLEHLLPAASDISWLLRTTPGPVALATSREALRIAGEWVMVVEPLATTGADSPAVDLFLQLSRRSMSTIPPFLLEDGRDDAAIREICAMLGGFPLALELAAAQMDVLAPGDVLALMRDAGLGVLASTHLDERRRFARQA